MDNAEHEGTHVRSQGGAVCSDRGGIDSKSAHSDCLYISEGLGSSDMQTYCLIPYLSFMTMTCKQTACISHEMLIVLICKQTTCMSQSLLIAMVRTQAHG